MDKPFQTDRRVRWGLGLFLALSLPSLAVSHEVDFSMVMPEADQVYLVGSFNGWVADDASLMANEDGIWRKTLSLDEGTHIYNFKAEGGDLSGEGWLLDWKSSRESRKQRGRTSSILVVPDDLDAFRARQRHASETKQKIEIPLFYDRYPDEGASSRPRGYAFCPLQSTPPAGDWKLPEFAGNRPLFAVVSLGQSEFLVAFDQPSAGTSFYNRVYFDRNGNRDLTDEEPLDGKPKSYNRENYFDCSFPASDLEIDVEGHRLPYCLDLRISGSMPAPGSDDTDNFGNVRNLRVLAMSHCAYLGEVALDGTGYRIALSDSSANGTFDEMAHLQNDTQYSNQRLNAQGDSFFIDTADRVSQAEGLLLGRFLALGDRLFEVQLDIPAGQMTLTPWRKELGTLELPNPVKSMAMLSTSGAGGLMLVRAGQRTAVPSGTWRLMNYQQTKTDEWGDEWALRANGSEETPPITVPLDGSVSLAIGEPLQAVVEIPEWGLQQAVAKGSLRLSLGIIGHLNEQITDLRRISGTNTQHKLAKRDTNRPEEPTYRIIKPDGELITSGSFEYG